MKREYRFRSMLTDLEILVEKTPMTSKLKELVSEADFYNMVERVKRPIIESSFRDEVVSSSDPWSDVMYQSLYISAEGNPADRIILQEPATKDPAVGMMVLKAARLQGESGMVFCGTESQLKTFIAKLPQYEKIGDEEDLKEKEFLECLKEAAESEGLKIIFHRLSVEHGGEEEEE